MALKDYIDRKNEWKKLFGSPRITYPLSQRDVDWIAKDLDSDLSPENLHCDGEISLAEAQAKYDFYSKVYEELEAYCLKNWLDTPVVYEL